MPRFWDKPGYPEMWTYSTRTRFMLVTIVSIYNAEDGDEKHQTPTRNESQSGPSTADTH